VARTALRVIVEENLPQRSAELGAWFLAELQSLKHPAIKEIRGRGLLVGIELHGPARSYCERLAGQGLLCKETHDNVIRLAPPLVTAREDLAWALERIRTVFSAG
jgi:ornithine--oxo-acid transaminase